MYLTEEGEEIEGGGEEGGGGKGGKNRLSLIFFCELWIFMNSFFFHFANIIHRYQNLPQIF